MLIQLHLQIYLAVKNHLIKILLSLVVKFSGLESEPEVLPNAINYFDCLTVNSAGSVYLIFSISI